MPPRLRGYVGGAGGSGIEPPQSRGPRQSALRFDSHEIGSAPTRFGGQDEKIVIPSRRIMRRYPARFMEIAPRARKREILQIGRAAHASRDYVFDVKSSALETVMHLAILASPVSPSPNFTRQIFRNAHYGCLPRICNASPRTSDSCSLNSTNASSSSLSHSCKSPSLLRSIRS